MINKNDEFLLIYKNSLTFWQKQKIKKLSKNTNDSFSVPYKIDFTPILFSGDIKNSLYLYAFRSERDIPIRFQKKYSLSKQDIESIIIEIDSIKNQLGKDVILIINPFGDDYVELTQAELQNYKSKPTP